jgi:HEAT repeat protein
MSFFGLFGPPNVEELKAKGNIKGLIKALSYHKNKTKDYKAQDIREAAAKALGQIGDPRAIRPLSIALRDRWFGVRVEAVRALGQIDDASVLKPLIAAFRDDDLRVYKAAVESLVQLGQIAMEPLVTALKDKDYKVRYNAAETLGQIGDAQAVQPLVVALNDEIQAVRSTAAAALGKIGDPSAVEPLLKALEEKDVGTQENAIEALVQIGDPRAIKPILTRAHGTFARKAVIWLRSTLNRVAANATEEDLRAVASLTLFEWGVTYADPHCGADNEWGNVPIDCSQVKQLARQELIRRGLEV